MTVSRELDSATLRVAAASDSSRIGQTVTLWSNGQQAIVFDANGQTLVAWSQDVRFGEATSVERRTPGWAILLGFVFLSVFPLGMLFFFIKSDVPVCTDTVTVHDDQSWVTAVATTDKAPRLVVL